MMAMVLTGLDPILAALQTQLDDALQQSGTVPLNSTTLGSAGAGVIAQFSESLGVSAIVAGASSTGVQPTVTANPTANTVTVTGTATAPLLNITNPSVVAVFTVTGQSLEVVLTIGTGTGWTLAQSFPLLGASVFGQLSFDASTPPTFVLRTQDGPADTFGPVQTAGLNLAGSVTLTSTSPASELLTLLPSVANPLPMAGPVSIASDTETLSLRGAGPSFSLSIPRFVPLPFSQAAPVISGTSTVDKAKKQVNILTVQVWGMVGAGAATLPLSVQVPISLEAWGVSLVPGKVISFGALANVFSNLPILDVVPDAIKNISALEIDALALRLTPDRTAFTSLYVTVASTTRTSLSWTIVPDVLKLTGLSVTLAVVDDGQGNLTTTGLVEGDFELGSSLSISIQLALPIGSGPWSLTAYPDVALPNLGTLAKVIGGADLASMLPGKLGQIGGFTLATLELTFDPSTLTFASVGIGLNSTTPWPVIPGSDQLVIQSVNIELTVATPLSNPGLAGLVSGYITIGDADVTITVGRPTPSDDWYLEVEVDNVDLPSLGTLAQLAGSDVASLVPAKLADNHFTIYSLTLDVNLSAGQMQVFSANVGSDNQWPIVDPYLVVEAVDFTLDLDWRSGSMFVSGSLAAQFDVAGVTFYLMAQYPGTGGWIFSGGLLPDEVLHLTDAVRHFLPSLPPQVPDVTLSGIDFSFDTSDGSFTFDAQTAVAWRPSLSQDLSFSLVAAVQIQRTINQTTQQAVYSGYIEGDIGTHFGTHSLDLKIRYAFQPGSNTYVFTLKFDSFELIGTVTTGTNKDTILTVQLGDLSFGQIVTYLVNLADPSLHFELTSPWDVLNKINFKNLSLIVNFTKKSVGISYALNENLVLVDIKTVGLTYLQRNGQGTVDIFFTGTFGGQEYDESNPLTWDMLNESPPTPAGEGSQIFDLQYLGLGQHLALVDPKADTMAKVIADLTQTILNAEGGEPPWVLLQFDRSSSWLVGAQFTVMGFLSLGMVFNDPRLYGLRVALAGEKAGSLSGLDFEILYRKISDTIGVYHIDLTLPDIMRHLEFGEVSVTLPIIIIDVYTNGNFRIDFGFPVNGDFSNSFAIEVFPFVGYGGFYFALLSGETSSKVPKISNGSFNPVIEFGLALAIGVGKTFEAGPLSAGLSVAVQGILEGVIGWFNPSSAAVKSDRYYWIQGTIAIVGKLYGTVDFVVIKASIEVVAYASATLTIECYQPIYIELSVGVRVTASLKILFITLHFSFSMHLEASFVIGSASTPPWNVISAPSGGGAQLAASRLSMLTRQRHALARRVERARVRRLSAVAQGLTWQPVAVLPNAPVPLPVNLLPVFTVAETTTPQVQVVMTLFAPNNVSPTASSVAEVRLLGANDAGTTTFDQIVLAMLSWAIQSQLGRLTGSIAETDLTSLYDDLSTTAQDNGFTYGNLSQFLGLNFRFSIGQLDVGAPPTGAAVMPMPPAFTMTPRGGPTIDFSQHNMVDATYEQQIAAYFNQLTVNYEYDRAQDPLADEETPLQPVAITESLASVIFRDYFLLLTKSAVQSCRDLLKSFPYSVQSPDSLASIAADFVGNVAYTVQAGDTLGSIAFDFDVSPAAIVAANPSVQFAQPLVPGAVLQIPPRIADAAYYTNAGDTLATISAGWGVSQQEIVAANPDVNFSSLQAGTLVLIPVGALLFAMAEANMDREILNAGTSLTLQNVTYQVRAGDTLASIANTWLGTTDPTSLVALNATASTIFVPGATVQIAQAGQTTFNYAVQADDTLPTIAAYVFVRNLGTVPDPNLAWFSQTIVQLNADAGLDYSQPFPAGTVLAIPNATLGEQGITQQTPNLAYTTKPGDTLTLVAGYFLMTEINSADLSALAAAIQTLNPTIAPGTEIKIPAQTHVLASTDTLASLAALFGVTVQDLGTVNAAATGLLATQAALTLPPLTHTIASGETLRGIAATYNMTLDAFIGRIGSLPGAIAPTSSTKKTLSIPQALQVPIDDLLATFVSQGEANNASGIVSRFLYHGLQLPDPNDLAFRAHELEAIADGLANDTEFSALYALTGQQFVAPPSDADFTIAFTSAAAANWLVFTTTYTTQPNDTLASIAQQFGVTAAQIQQINPGVNWNAIPQGTVLEIPQPRLQIVLTPAIMQQYYPSTTFTPEITSGPRRLPLAQSAPVRYTFSQDAAWQSAGPLPFAGFAPGAQTVGPPGIWSFPSTLVSRVQSDDALHPYELVVGSPGDLSMSPTPVTAYDWATIVPITVREVPGATAGSQLPNTYLMLGADQNGRDVLVSLLEYLNASGDQAQLSLLYSANPTSPNPSGYVSDALDLANTALLKTNLSTLTQSGAVGTLQAPQASALPPSGEYFATMSAGAALVELLWECSIVGSGGYYLHYATTDGNGLPASLFVNGSEATLWLVVILASQSAEQNPNRTLYPFSNCAVVQDKLDPNTSNVFAEATDGSNMTLLATVPPGNVGVELTRTNPSSEADSAGQRTEGLFSLMEYEAPSASNTFFASTMVGLPAGPVDVDKDTMGGLALPLAANDDDTVWYFKQVIPVSQMAIQPAPTYSPALPSASQNPYAGVAAGSEIELAVAFRDVFGNEVTATPPIPTVTIPVGYYDRLLGLGSWPGATGSYSFSLDNGIPTLNVVVNIDVAKYVPSASNTFATAVRTAANHLLKYQQIYYQIQQPDVRFSIATSLDQPSAGPIPDPLARQVLAGFVSAATIFLNVAQSLQPVRFTTPDANQTLDTVAAAYSVSLDSLVTANSDDDASLLFGAPVTIPIFHVAAAGDTLAGSVTGALTVTQLVQQNDRLPLNAGVLLSTAATMYTTASGDSLASIADLLSVDLSRLALANAATPNILNPAVQVTVQGITVPITTSDTFASLVTELAGKGVTTTVVGLATANQTLADLFLPSVTIAIGETQTTPRDTTGSRSYETQAGDTLAGIAGMESSSVAGIAVANSQAANILNPAVQVTVLGVTLPIVSADTFVSLVAKFAAQNVQTTVPGIAVANQNLVDLFLPSVSLTIADYLVQSGDTVASLCATYSQFSIASLATYNQFSPRNVFPSGTPLYLSSTTSTPLPGQTLAEIAQANAITVEQLGAYNGPTALALGATLAIPSAVAIDSVRTFPYAAYQATGQLTFGAICTNLDLTAAAVATLNATMPSLFNVGVTIHYPGTPVTTLAGDTFTTLAARAGTSVATFAADASVTGQTGLIAAGALFILNLPVVGSRTLGDLAADYGVALSDLAMANSALIGFISAGAPFSAGGKQVTSAADDTLQSLVYRFAAEQQVTTTVSELALANQGLTGALVSTASFVVPPRAATRSVAFPTPFVPAPIFPLTVSLGMSRDESLIDPEFVGVANVLTNETLLSPRPVAGDDGSLSLQGFAEAFEGAFASYRLKVATGPETADTDDVSRPLWLVDFGSGGFSQVDVQGSSPIYYALAPLSTELQARPSVSIAPYDPTTGTLGTAQAQNFQSIDLDVWLGQLLEAIDLFLTPQYAVPALLLAPGSMDRIVAAKGTIAAYLQQQVYPVLGSPAPQPTAVQQAAAQEALYQSMLVSLSTALSTDAIVQVPVAVQSPYGQPYTTGQTDSFGAVATYFQVSQPYVALALAQASGILNANLVVSYGGLSYTILATDTLQSIATHYGVSVQQLPSGLQVPAGQGLFAAGVTLPLSVLSRQPVAADTFATLAAYFGTSVGTVAIANETVPGSLTAGQQVTIGGTSYVVKAGDTLLTVAAAFGLTPDAFAENAAVLHQAGLTSSLVTFHCGSDNGPIAPRLSGNPVVQLYVTGPADGIAQLLAYFTVSQESLLDAIGTMPRILNVGLTVTYASQTYEIQDGDTLATVAAQYGVAVSAFVDGVQVPSGSGLFAAGQTINLSSIVATPTADDSFQTLAGYFGVEPADVATANENVHDIFVTGETVTIGNASYVVKSGDTLIEIGAAFSLSPAELASNPAIAPTTGLFNPSTPLYGLQPVPDTALSTAKVSLTNGGSLATFLFSTPSEASFRDLFLNVDYVVNELEFNVSDVPGVEGYQASNWLSFLVPIDSTGDVSGVSGEIGQIDIPIPLRTYPTLPALLTQSGTTTDPSATTFPTVKEWDFSFSYQHQDAAQDTPYVQATFNDAATLTLDRAAPDPFPALAQFAEVYPALKEGLAQLTEPAATPAQIQFLQNVIGTFETLVTGVATVWDGAAASIRQRIHATPPSSSTNLYRVDYTYTMTQPSDLASVKLTAIEPPNPALADWPNVAVLVPGNPTPVTLPPDAPAGSERVYTVPASVTIPAFTPLTWQLTFPDNDVVAYQNAWGGAYVTRNESLVTTAPTNPAFVYRTPLMRFNDKVVPLVTNGTIIPIGAGSGLQAAVEGFLGAVLNAAPPDYALTSSYTLKLTLLYGHTLLPAPDDGLPVVSYVPVRFIPQAVLGPAYSIASFAADLQTEVTNWIADNGPVLAAGDTYVLQAALYSSLPNQAYQPILQLALPTYAI